jgi:acyl-coenzyme A synthetase/AMP-(fatty) acid ligase
MTENGAITDPVPRDAQGAREIGFALPERYNASAILFDNLAAGPGGRVAVTGPAGSRTYAELAADASRWGAGLLSLGAQRGDRVLLFLDDTPAYPAALFGAIRAGLVPLLINTLTPSDLLQFYLADSSARFAICDAAFADRFNAVACQGTRLETLLVANGAAHAAASVRLLTATEWLSAPTLNLAPADTHRDDMAFWMYSSGSTGRPKGIVHLQHDMAYTHRSYARHFLALTENDICFSVPKIFFAYGLGNSITFPFAAGAASVLLPGQPKPAAITKAPEVEAADLSSLRLAVSAAEVLSAEVFNAWKAISGLDIMEGLGSTEVLHIYLSNAPEKKKLGSAGKRVPGYEVKLTDAAGREVADGEEGILWVRGQSNAPCYWNRADKTAETMREGGWIYTGDRFVRDSEGFHFFRGRADDLVKVSGQWVYPLEVELCLADHPSVRECAVLAVAQADGLTTLKAFVVLADAAPGSDGVTRELQEFVKGKLLPYKYPRMVAYLGELPKTGTGKIDRQALLKHGD